MENTANEFVRLFRERLKYPIITVYSIILIIYNWDVLAIFFLSSQKIENRIAYINTIFKGQTFGRLFWPLIKAIGISIIAPVIMWGLDVVLKKVTFKRQKIRNDKHEQDWIAKKNIARHEFEYEQSKTGKKEIQDWEDKVSELEHAHKVEIETLKEINQTLENTFNQTRNNLNNKISNLEGEKNNIQYKLDESISLYGYNNQDNEINKQINSIIDYVGTFDKKNSLNDIKTIIAGSLVDIIEGNYQNFRAVKFSKNITADIIDYMINNRLVYIDIKTDTVKLTPIGLIIHQIVVQDLE